MMAIRIQGCILLLALLVTAFPGIGRTAVNIAGGYADVTVTDERVVAAAAFAVKAKEKTLREKKETPSAKLTLVRILGAQQQVVAGMNYRLRLAVRLNKAEKQAEAVVFRKLSGAYELTAWEWK
jgi:hypothetical protein